MVIQILALDGCRVYVCVASGEAGVCVYPTIGLFEHVTVDQLNICQSEPVVNFLRHLERMTVQIDADEVHVRVHKGEREELWPISWSSPKDVATIL